MDSINRFTFSLALALIATSIAAQEDNVLNIPTPPQPPVPPSVSARNSDSSIVHLHFSSEQGQVDIQIIGKVPSLNAHDNTQLDFQANSELRATIQKQGENRASTLIWNSAGCTRTKTVPSQACTLEEREQILKLIKQIPTPPIPPSD